MKDRGQLVFVEWTDPKTGTKMRGDKVPIPAVRSWERGANVDMPTLDYRILDAATGVTIPHADRASTAQAPAQESV